MSTKKEFSVCLGVESILYTGKFQGQDKWEALENATKYYNDRPDELVKLLFDSINKKEVGLRIQDSSGCIITEVK